MATPWDSVSSVATADQWNAVSSMQAGSVPDQNEDVTFPEKVLRFPNEVIGKLGTAFMQKFPLNPDAVAKDAALVTPERQKVADAITGLMNTRAGQDIMGALTWLGIGKGVAKVAPAAAKPLGAAIENTAAKWDLYQLKPSKANALKAAPDVAQGKINIGKWRGEYGLGQKYRADMKTGTVPEAENAQALIDRIETPVQTMIDNVTAKNPNLRLDPYDMVRDVKKKITDGDIQFKTNSDATMAKFLVDDIYQKPSVQKIIGDKTTLTPSEFNQVKRAIGFGEKGPFLEGKEQLITQLTDELYHSAKNKLESVVPEISDPNQAISHLITLKRVYEDAAGRKLNLGPNRLLDVGIGGWGLMHLLNDPETAMKMGAVLGAKKLGEHYLGGGTTTGAMLKLGRAMQGKKTWQPPDVTRYVPPDPGTKVGPYSFDPVAGDGGATLGNLGSLSTKRKPTVADFVGWLNNKDNDYHFTDPVDLGDLGK